MGYIRKVRLVNGLHIAIAMPRVVYEGLLIMFGIYYANCKKDTMK